MSTQDLHTIISQKIDLRWSDWAQQHPHLAEVIDRVRLVESVVTLLSEDTEFVRAMREADLDAARLGAASKLLEQAELTIRKLLPV